MVLCMCSYMVYVYIVTLQQCDVRVSILDLVQYLNRCTLVAHSWHSCPGKLVCVFVFACPPQAMKSRSCHSEMKPE